jgi:membrane-bound lytic murein transglycosylase F
MLLAGLLCAGCQERLDTQGRPLDAPGVDHPAVDRDLGRIRESGVLRLVTHYSSSSYFIHKGGPAGFDYELVERFAREHKLSVDVVIPRHGEDMVSLLNAGKGDIV